MIIPATCKKEEGQQVYQGDGFVEMIDLEEKDGNKVPRRVGVVDTILEDHTGRVRGALGLATIDPV